MDIGLTQTAQPCMTKKHMILSVKPPRRAPDEKDPGEINPELQILQDPELQSLVAQVRVHRGVQNPIAGNGLANNI